MELAGERLPRLVILDLDHTLWPTNAFEEARGPYAATEEVGVAKRLRRNRVVRCYAGVPEAMQFLSDHGVCVAIASATPSQSNALALLTAMQLVPRHMEDEWNQGRFFVCRPGMKEYHLTRLLREASCSAEEAIFFDDMNYNISSACALQISAVKIDRSLGFSLPVLLAGVDDWRRYRQPSIERFFARVSRDEYADDLDDGDVAHSCQSPASQEDSDDLEEQFHAHKD